MICPTKRRSPRDLQYTIKDIIHGDVIHTISKSMAPTDQRSAFASYFWNFRISGAWKVHDGNEVDVTQEEATI